jgi:AmmeMemoRadiSam system protein A
MTNNEKHILLHLARKSVRAAANGEELPDLPGDEICQRPGGAFVTLKQKGRLRGCIGHFTGVGTLGSTVMAMAREAAVSDPRFVPVAPEEVHGLTIEISVLSPMERIEAEDVVPGKHGLYITQGSRAGTLLPQVAEAEGWNREVFLSHTCIKAGLSPDAYKQDGTDIFVYTAEVFSENETGKEVW